MKPVSELLAQQANGTLWHMHPQDTVFDALRLLAEYEAGALMVMEGGRLVGVLSERDYTRKVALQGRNSRTTTVAEIMSRNVFTVSPRADIRECIALMKERKVRHLPVVDGGTVMGMIAVRDLLDHLIAEQDTTIGQLESYINT
jgi:CBS domain-containing protein